MLAMDSHQRCRYFQGAFLMVAAVLMTGCRSAQISAPTRTAVEQLVISTAADRALDRADFTWLNGKSVYLDEKYFDSIDKVYVLSAVRNRLSRDGALLVDWEEKADVIVEIRSGALGMNLVQGLIGVPSFTVPIPFAGPVQTPEISVYKSVKAEGIGKFALFAYQRQSGEYVQSTGALSGRSYFNLYKLIYFGWARTDIPELNPKDPKR